MKMIYQDNQFLFSGTKWISFRTGVFLEPKRFMIIELISLVDDNTAFVKI
jgi:hypothetical protein